MESFSDNYGRTVCAASLIGGRQENQDSYGYAETALGLLVMVCDGMGGGPSGKTASTMAVHAIAAAMQADDGAGADPAAALTKAIQQANLDLIQAQLDNNELMGMGTTCVVALVTPAKAWIAHIGDSRCYVIRRDKVVFRTADHSFVAELVRKGTITEEEARNASNSNIITRAVGLKPDTCADVATVSLKDGDRLALMSDGIWGAMPQQRLVAMLAAREPLEKVVGDVASVVDAIGDENGGSHDNLTLLMVQIPPKGSAQASLQAPEPEPEPEAEDGGIVDGAATGPVYSALPPDTAVPEPAAQRQERRAVFTPRLIAGLVTLAVVLAVCGLLLGFFGNDKPAQPPAPPADTIEDVTDGRGGGDTPTPPTPSKPSKGLDVDMAGVAEGVTGRASESVQERTRIRVERLMQLLQAVDTCGSGVRKGYTGTPEQRQRRLREHERLYKEIERLALELGDLAPAYRPLCDTLQAREVKLKLVQGIDNHGLTTAEAKGIIERLTALLQRLQQGAASGAKSPQ